MAGASSSSTSRFVDADAPRWYDVVAVLVLVSGALFLAAYHTPGALTSSILSGGVAVVVTAAGIIAVERDDVDGRLERFRR